MIDMLMVAAVNNTQEYYDFILKIGSTVVMPIVLSLGTALITNLFQSNQKQKEYENALKKLDKENQYDLKINCYKSDYLSARDSFSEVIKTVGDFLGDIEDDQKYALAMSSIIRSQLLADEKLESELSFFLKVIGSFRNSGEERETNTVFANNQLMEVAICMKKQLDKNSIKEDQQITEPKKQEKLKLLQWINKMRDCFKL